MDSAFVSFVLVVLFLGLVAGGHRSIERGSNRDVANSVVLVAVAVVVAILSAATLAPYL